MPKVSIILPTYNRAATIERAIASVQAQTFEDWELIIFDDGSKLPAQLPDHPKIKIERSEKNMGAAAARNCAIAQARGQYIAFIDSDDQWHPSYLKKQIANLEQNQAAGLSYSLSRINGRISWPAQTKEFQCEMLLNNFIPSLSQVVVRRFAVRRWFVPQLKVVHDREFYLSLFATHEPAYLPEIQVTRYHQGDNLVLADGGRLWLEDGLLMFRLFFLQPKNQKFECVRAQAEQNLRDRVAWVNGKGFLGHAVVPKIDLLDMPSTSPPPNQL